MIELVSQLDKLLHGSLIFAQSRLACVASLGWPFSGLNKHEMDAPKPSMQRL